MARAAASIDPVRAADRFGTCAETAEQIRHALKHVGWLLRETAKSDAKRTVPYLMKIRGRAPRRARHCRQQ